MLSLMRMCLHSTLHSEHMFAHSTAVVLIQSLFSIAAVSLVCGSPLPLPLRWYQNQSRPLSFCGSQDKPRAVWEVAAKRKAQPEGYAQFERNKSFMHLTSTAPK